MCRFTLYLGPSLTLSSLLTEPKHSLINQSIQSKERLEPMNGDGFGVAWYSSLQSNPARFRSVTPAWSNDNLESIASVVSSHCVLAHIRAATQGHTAEANCHPFISSDYAFMHNGNLGGFRSIRRALMKELSDAAFDGIRGETDSEHIFAVFLDTIGRDTKNASASDLAAALQKTLERVIKLSRSMNADFSYLNFAVANGQSAAACRFTTKPEYDGESLYVNQGHRYVCEAQVCRMISAADSETATIVSSEPLSEDGSWQRIPRNHVICFDQSGQANLSPIEVH